MVKVAADMVEIPLTAYSDRRLQAFVLRVCLAGDTLNRKRMVVILSPHSGTIR
jgi:hypothetical protein